MTAKRKLDRKGGELGKHWQENTEACSAYPLSFPDQYWATPLYRAASPVDE